MKETKVSDRIAGHINENRLNRQYWVEPAHFIRLQEALSRLDDVIKDAYQDEIDRKFDSVARKIGFVVTTTIPVTLEIKEGSIVDIQMGAENLKETIFEEMFADVFDTIKSKVNVRSLKLDDGIYDLELNWNAAKKYLRKVIPEPAHYRAIDPGMQLMDYYKPWPDPWESSRYWTHPPVSGVIRPRPKGDPVQYRKNINDIIDFSPQLLQDFVDLMRKYEI